MNEKTPNLHLPYIMSAQAQKHVTHNEAIRALDALVQLSVINWSLSTPPVSPENGERYLVAINAGDEWTGKENQIAAWQDGAWEFYTPLQGWVCWVEDEHVSYVWDGANWISTTDSVNPVDMVGVNTTADATNRISVSSPASIFTHEGDDHRLKINKAATNNTASVLFQSDWSGRAEFGLAGDDDWHVKVSPDGVNWNETLIADSTTGAIRFPFGIEHAATRTPMTSLIHTPGGGGENSIWRFDLARSSIPRQADISSVSGDVITLTAALASQFFTNSQMENVSYVRIWNMSKSPEQSAWVKRVNNPGTDTELQVLDSADISSWSNGETVQLGEPASQIPSNVVAIDISPMMQNMLGNVFRQAGILVKATLSANGVAGHLGVTPTGAGGSFTNIFGQSDGSITSGQITTTTTELSPISNSNLLFIREKSGISDSLLVAAVSVFGIWV